MPLLSDYARKKKTKYFFKDIPKTAKILEVGSGYGWLGKWAKENGWVDYIGVDIEPPADIIGDIRNWKELGLPQGEIDVIIAFEIVEHVDIFKECYELLKPGGKMMITTPVPAMDWILKILEMIGLNQKRTSPHDHLVKLKNVPHFEKKEIKIVSLMSQWGIFTKQPKE